MPDAMQALRRGTATETGEADDNASEGSDDNASDNAPASADGGEGAVFQVEDPEDEATFGGEEAHYPRKSPERRLPAKSKGCTPTGGHSNIEAFALPHGWRAASGFQRDRNAFARRRRP